MDKALAQKLLQFQKEITAIKKDSENPFFHSKYFDVNKVIEVIRPILNKLGLVILQPLSTVDNKPAIITYIIDADSGAEFDLVSPITDLPKAQDMGSAITYWRRYALVSMLLLQGEQDDDGNVASQAKQYPKYIKKADMYPTRKVVDNTTPDNGDSPF